MVSPVIFQALKQAIMPGTRLAYVDEFISGIKRIDSALQTKINRSSAGAPTCRPQQCACYFWTSPKNTLYMPVKSITLNHRVSVDAQRKVDSLNDGK